MPRRISLDKYNEIKELVAPPRQTAQDKRREEKQALSEQRMKCWPDTLEAQRKRKERFYYERLEAQEAERVRMDREEDQRRARERQAKIEYAAQTIYRQTDKVKQLASAELLSDCLHARKQQLHLNQLLSSAEEKWEARFLQMEEETRAKLDKRDKEEKLARKTNAKNVAKVQQEQLEEVRERFKQTLKEEEEEGKRLLELAKKAAEEGERKRKEKTERDRLNRIEVKKTNEELRKIKEKLEAEEAMEDAKIAAYAKAKAELKLRQEAQFKKIETAKQRRREEMIEQGTRRLMEINSQNNLRLENEIAEARRVQDERVRLLEEKNIAFAKKIHDSRQNQIKFREEQRAVQEEKDKRLAERWRAHNRGTDAAAKLEARSEYEAAKQHQQILLNQVTEKKEREIEERRQQIFEARKIEELASNELNEFQALAQQRIEAVKAQGKDPYPLIKCFNDVSNGKRFS